MNKAFRAWIKAVCIIAGFCVPQMLSALNSGKIEWEIFRIVNQQRIIHGLTPLRLHRKLTKVARMHSGNMVAQGFFSHTDKQGRTPFDRLDQYLPELGWRAAAENIAFNYGNTAEEAASNLMVSWMNSPGHRVNILSSNFTDIGIGVVQSDRYIYATQLFTDTTSEITASDIQIAPDYCAATNKTDAYEYELIARWDYLDMDYRIAFPQEWEYQWVIGGTSFFATNRVAEMIVKLRKTKTNFTAEVTAGMLTESIAELGQIVSNGKPTPMPREILDNSLAETGVYFFAVLTLTNGETRRCYAAAMTSGNRLFTFFGLEGPKQKSQAIFDAMLRSFRIDTNR